MNQLPESKTFDYIIIGSGFGGSISAMRLVEKGYSVLVLERGKRFKDVDFPKTNWIFWKYLWAPRLRCFGILQISLFRNVLVLHGSGVGGGSLGYANVLMRPSDELFNHPSWRHLADWKAILKPHYSSAERMLGVTRNPCLWPADQLLHDIATEHGVGPTFTPTQVGTFFGEPGKEGIEVPDPYFNGEGPSRSGCTHCGACMVGCRYNAKNTLVKNYLYFAEKWGAQVMAECEVCDVRPLADNQPDGARYEVVYKKTTSWILGAKRTLRAKNVIFAASALGTQRLLFRCREITKSLPKISNRLGSQVRTNSEALLGVTARDLKVDYSKGIAITSIMNIDPVTTVEPVRYPAGSSLMRFLSGPLIDSGERISTRVYKSIKNIVLHPVDFLKTHVLPGWAQRSTIILVMQTIDNNIHLRHGRSFFTLFQRNLVSIPDEINCIPCKIDIGHEVTQQFAQKTGGIPVGTINEGLLNVPMTAHILGGCPMGVDDTEGVVGIDCQIFNYPGLYVVDGSIMPGNPGVNPSLSIAALAEYAMSLIPPEPGVTVHKIT